MTDTLNHTLYLFINAGSETPTALIDIAAFLAKKVIYLIPPMLLAMWLWGNGPYRNSALKALLVTVVALGCNQLIGIYFPTLRPFELGVGHTYLEHAPTPSFPSNHLAIFFSISLCLIRGAAPRLGVVVLIAGAIVAWARVFVGVHFPIDMVGSIFVTLAVYLAITPLWRHYGPAITAQFERLYRRVLALPISAGWLRE